MLIRLDPFLTVILLESVMHTEKCVIQKFKWAVLFQLACAGETVIDLFVQAIMSKSRPGHPQLLNYANFRKF